MLTTEALAVQECSVSVARKVTVAPSVRIEVHDWGGRGEPLIFLAGIGNTFRVFNDFAPLFTDKHRVIGLTRRGTPPSDSSLSGYGADVLIADIVAVMDSLSFRAAHVAGWSFGGDEAILLAATRPQRVLSVILLDSYDNSASDTTFRSLDRVDTLPVSFSAFDSSSVHAFLWRRRRFGLRAPPLAEVCTIFRFGSDGRYQGVVLPVRIESAALEGIPRLPYDRVKQRVLAFYNSPREIGDVFPYVGGADSTFRAQAQNALPVFVTSYATARTRMKNEIPHAKIIEIQGASHAIFRSNPEIVYLEMRRFLSRR